MWIPEGLGNICDSRCRKAEDVSSGCNKQNTWTEKQSIKCLNKSDKKIYYSIACQEMSTK